MSPGCRLAIKSGPVMVKYEGTVKLEETEEEPHRAVIEVYDKDARGQGIASATTTSTLHEEGSGTRGRVETGIQLTGRVAQFGRGVQQDVTEKIMDQFSDCVKKELF